MVHQKLFALVVLHTLLCIELLLSSERCMFRICMYSISWLIVVLLSLCSCLCLHDGALNGVVLSASTCASPRPTLPLPLPASPALSVQPCLFSTVCPAQLVQSGLPGPACPAQFARPRHGLSVGCSIGLRAWVSSCYISMLSSRR